MLTHDEKVIKAKQAAARAQARLQKLQSQERAADTATKVLVGALVLKIVKKQKNVTAREWILREMEKVEREHDKKRLEPLVSSLRAIQPAPAAVEQG